MSSSSVQTKPFSLDKLGSSIYKKIIVIITIKKVIQPFS